MAQSQQETRITGDAAQFIQEVGKMISKSKEHEAAIKKLTGETKKLTNEEKKLAREAKRVYEETRTPQERHMRKVQELNRMVRKGAIDQQTYRRALKHSQQQFAQTGKAGRDAFGPAALQQLKSYATGLLAIPALIGAVTQALREQKQVRDELAAKQRQAAHPLGRLATLAGGDIKKTKRYQGMAREFYGLGGAEDLRQAGDVTFEMLSADPKLSSADLKFMARQSTVDDPAKVAGAAGVIMAAMGKKETGSFRALASKAAAAAAPATRVDPGQILIGTADPAEAAKPLGLSDEDVMGAVSIIAEKTGSAEKAGTRVNALLRSLGRKGFVEKHKGKSLPEMLEVIRGKGMTMPEQIKYFGRQEAQQAFGALEPAALRARVGEIQQAEETGMAEKVVEAALGDPIVREDFRRRKTKAGKELAGEPLGVAASRVQSGIDWLETQYLKTGDETGAMAIRAGGRVARIAYGDTALSSPEQGAGMAGRTVVGAAIGANPAFDVLLDVAGALREATQNLLKLGPTAEKLDEAAEEMKTAARTRPVTVNVE